MSVVEAERNFSRIKMESFSCHSTVGIEPIFGITSKPFDPGASVNARSNDSGGTSNTFVLPEPSERDRAALTGSFTCNPAFLPEGFYQATKNLYSRSVTPNTEAHPATGSVQDKKIKQSFFPCLLNFTGIPCRSPTVSSSEPPAGISTIGTLPSTNITIFVTTFHERTILYFVGRCD